MAAIAARPLAELLDCPAETGNLLTGAAQSLECAAGECVFRQSDLTRGLYLIVKGEFLRKAERLNARVSLGIARPGDLVELAAALGFQQHTYTLTALSAGTLLLLPLDVLQQAFERYPPLRMNLLQELAREVSRAYRSCTLTRVTPARRHGNNAASA